MSARAGQVAQYRFGKCPPSPAGFTLIEIIMTVLIISLLTVGAAYLMPQVLKNTFYLPNQVQADMVAASALEIMAEGGQGGFWLAFQSEHYDGGSEYLGVYGPEGRGHAVPARHGHGNALPADRGWHGGTHSLFYADRHEVCGRRRFAFYLLRCGECQHWRRRQYTAGRYQLDRASGDGLFRQNGRYEPAEYVH